MFYKLEQDIARRRDLTWTDKGVFAALKDRMGNNGHCWPGLRRLAQDCGVRPGTVKDSVHRLAAAGLVEIENRGNGRSFSYRITVTETVTLSEIGKCDGNRHGVLRKPSRKRIENRHITRQTKNQSKNATAKILFDPATVAFTGISQNDLSRWQSTYPALDVGQEILKAAEWLVANPSRRKKDNRRFLVNWLARGQKWATERGTKEPSSDSEEYWARKEAAGDFEDFDRRAGIGKHAGVTQ